jgi:hypothetical protein
VIQSHPDSVRVGLRRVWHRVSTLHSRAGDQGRGQVLATPALGRLNQGRVRSLISLTHPGKNQVPRLVCARPRATSPDPRDLSCTATRPTNTAPERPPVAPRRVETTPIDRSARSLGRRGRGSESRHPPVGNTSQWFARLDCCTICIRLIDGNGSVASEACVWISRVQQVVANSISQASRPTARVV